MSVVRTGQGIDDHREFACSWLETDKPVKCVLDGSGDAMGEFGTANEQRIRPSDRTITG